MKSFLIVFSESFATRAELIAYLDKLPEISFWHACLPNCVFLTSELAADQIAKKLESNFVVQNGQRFLVTQVSDNCQGRLPKQAWRLLQNPDSPRLPKENPPAN